MSVGKFSGREINGELNASGKRFAIVAARFNDMFSERLIQGAIDAVIRHGGSEENITLVRVPGSFEIAPVVKLLADKRKVDAVIALGCLIKGDTDHYDLIASNVASSLSNIMTDSGVPCTLGVICCDTMEQAMARAGSKVGNYGWSAAVAAIELVNVMNSIRSEYSSRDFGSNVVDAQVKSLREAHNNK